MPELEFNVETLNQPATLMFVTIATYGITRVIRMSPRVSQRPWLVNIMNGLSALVFAAIFVVIASSPRIAGLFRTIENTVYDYFNISSDSPWFLVAVVAALVGTTIWYILKERRAALITAAVVILVTAVLFEAVYDWFRFYTNNAIPFVWNFIASMINAVAAWWW